jgi:DTW domain-containing protein YfiP
MDSSFLSTALSENALERPFTDQTTNIGSSPATTVNSLEQQQEQQQQRQHQRSRPVCRRCHRPTPQACICEALPAQRIHLYTTEVVILQHPLEIKQHKATANRSVPLLELCLATKSLHLCVGRRLGNDMEQNILHKLHDSVNFKPVLVFPKLNTDVLSNSKTKKIFSLTELISRLKQEKELELKSMNASATSIADFEIPRSSTLQTTSTGPKAPTTISIPQKKILLLILDATWKYAREMHMANQKYHQYPSHMLQVALEKEDLQFNQQDSCGSHVHPPQQPRRFEIRGKVSNAGGKKAAHQEDTQTTWMCTAECVSLIVSRLEEELGVIPNSAQQLHETLMKPLDVMVAKWRAFVTSPKLRKHDLERGMSKKEKRKRLLQEIEVKDIDRQHRQLQQNETTTPISR